MAAPAPCVGVIGDGDCSPEEAELAETVGRELALLGAMVVCGGMGGVMHAVCKGASSVGGTTIGILPGDQREAANPYVTVPVVTGLGEARNVIVVKTAGALIAVGGRYGTLSEIAFALKLAKPIIGLGSWELIRQGEADDAIIRLDDPVEAARLAVALARVAGGRSG